MTIVVLKLAKCLASYHDSICKITDNKCLCLWSPNFDKGHTVASNWSHMLQRGFWNQQRKHKWLHCQIAVTHCLSVPSRLNSMTFSCVTNTQAVLNGVWVILVSPWVSSVVLGKKLNIKIDFHFECIGLDDAYGHNNSCILIVDV